MSPTPFRNPALRESLTILASILIAALTLALVGPQVVDWTGQRAFIEAKLSQAVGAPVTTRGSIGVVLLPTPRLELGGASLGDGRSVSLRTGAVRLELSVTPLLHGELRFLEAAVDEPELRVSLNGFGGWPALAMGDGARDVQFDRIDIRGGKLILEDPASGSLTLTGLDLRAEATSLNGPFRGAGSFAREGARVGFRFSTGARDGDKLRLKLVSDDGGGLPRIDADGALLMGANPSFEGPVILSGALPAPWRAVGVAALNPAGLQIEPLELRLGADEAPLIIGGQARFAFGRQPHGEIALSARQLDLDRVFGSKVGAAGLEPLLRGWLADASASGSVVLPLRIALTTPAAFLGGETLIDLSMEARLSPGAPLNLRMSAGGPGRSRLLLDGQVETGSAAAFRGQVDGAVGDLPRLGEWLAPTLPQFAEALRAAPFRSMEVAGAMDWSGAGFAARGLRLKADRSTFAGTAAFTRPVGDEPARLFADLTSDALDLDGVPDLSGFGAAMAKAELAFALDARAIRVARFGKGLIDAGRIRVKLAQNAAGLHLDTLSISGLGGADVTVTGDMGAQDGAFAVRVEAQRLVDLAAFLRRVAPGPVADGLVARAVALSPLALTMTVQTRRPSPAEPQRLASLAFDATARGSRWQASLKPEGQAGQVSGRVSVETRDAAMLIRQLGVETLPIAGAGGASLKAELAGAPDGAYAVDASGLLAGIDLGFKGQLSGSLAAPRAMGDLRLKTADAGPLLRVIGYGLPEITQALPVQANAALGLADGQLALTGLSGSAMGVTLSGGLEAQMGQNRPRLTGALELDRASLPALTTLLLGPPVPARGGALWGEGRFGPGLAELPEADFAIKAGQVTVLEGLSATGAGLRLTLAPGVLAFSEMTGALGQGRLEGRASLRRDGVAVSLSGALTVSGQPIPGSWAQGAWGGKLDFTSTGETPSALVGGLAGSGEVQLRGLVLPQADPGAPARVLAEAESGSLYISENDFMGALRREIIKAPLTLDTIDATAQASGGLVRLQSAQFAAAIDLRRMSLEARAPLPSGVLPKNWNGPPPQVAALWRGPLAAPQRDLDAGTFINALAARAIARESARIEALEADLRERALFARRKRGFDFLHQREREVAIFLAEQAKLDRERQERESQEQARREREQAEIEKGELEKLIRSLPPEIAHPH